MEIAGTTGVVTIPDLWQPARKASFLVRREAHVDEAIVEGEEQITHMIENFGRYVLTGEPVKPAPEEAVKTLAVMDALAKSARTGQVVEVNPA